jgi:hypothetical protein
VFIQGILIEHLIYIRHRIDVKETAEMGFGGCSFKLMVRKVRRREDSVRGNPRAEMLPGLCHHSRS